MDEIIVDLEWKIECALFGKKYSFIVMNKHTHDKLLKFYPPQFKEYYLDKISLYKNLEVLISEDVNDLEFKLGYDAVQIC